MEKVFIMKDQEILKKYIPMVDFIADICGSNYEVVLHDVSQPETSVIAIRNNENSGRNIGSPMTDLAIQIMESGKYKENDYIANYRGVGNGKEFLSSTYFIKNGDRLIGMLCINNDFSSIENLKESLQAFLNHLPKKSPAADEGYHENLGSPVVSLVYSIIEKTINELHVSPKRMSMDEKIQVVHKLNDQGILMLKGAVSEIAKQMNISEPTVYRYLNRK